MKFKFLVGKTTLLQNHACAQFLWATKTLTSALGSVEKVSSPTHIFTNCKMGLMHTAQICFAVSNMNHAAAWWCSGGCARETMYNRLILEWDLDRVLRRESGLVVVKIDHPLWCAPHWGDDALCEWVREGHYCLSQCQSRRRSPEKETHYFARPISH